MKAKLLHLYGPLYINSYGFFIAIAVFVFFYCLKHDRISSKFLDKKHLEYIFLYGFIAALLGGRLLFLWETSEYCLTSACKLWQGGFSLLGSIIAVTITIWGYLLYHRLPVLRITDRIALYALLFQSITRLGCFFAGCCYGLQTSLPWAITYTDSMSMAPLYIPLHPTQLYSSISLFSLFLIFYYCIQPYVTKQGILTYLYLFGVSSERFFVDFFRDDRLFVTDFYSNIQIIALLIATTSIIRLLCISKRTTT